MAIYTYPPEVYDFVKEHTSKMRDWELAEACNAALGTEFTAAKMKAYRANHHIRNYQKHHLTREEYWKHQKRWPQGMYEYIRDNSWNVSSAEMAERVNKLFGTNFTQYQMKSFCTRYHIRSGLTGWFRKGNPPGNKGRKQSEYCTPEKLARSAQTRFKKGHRPINEMPLGTICRSSEGYLQIKVAMQGTQYERWTPLHRWIWEQANGPVPEKHFVIFKDGNRDNCTLDNLMLISRGESLVMGRKGYYSDNPDLTEAGVNLVRLRIAAHKKKKEAQENGTRPDSAAKTELPQTTLA